MKHATRTRTYDRVARLGDAKLPLVDLFEEASRLLDGALPRDASCWHAMDPASLIETSYHIENTPVPDAKVAEVAYASADYNTFTDLAQGKRHSGVLSEQTSGDPARSRRYRELMQPHGIHGELRVSFVVDGSPWGCAAFFREGSGDFSAEERDFAHDIAALLGRAFRSAGVHARGTGPSAELWPGVLVVDGSRRVESVTPPARTWLTELGFAGTPERDPLPFAVLSFAERVRQTGDEATARVLGESGLWVQLHASLTSDQRVAVVLQAATLPSIAPLISAAYGLTARERELTELVLQGCATDEIAARLFVSPHTVQSHLKSIFGKIGVRSRRELVGRVFTP